MRFSTVFAVWVLINAVIQCSSAAKSRRKRKKKQKSQFTKIRELEVAEPGKKPVLLEGDIIVTRSLLSELDEMKRAADGIGVFDALNRGKWPNGIVPYTIKGKIAGSEPSRLEVAVGNAVDHYTEKLGGCIKWVLYPESEIKRKFKNYVTFFSDGGCYSALGRQPRPQVISLQVPGCIRQLGTAVHEMMHTLGFYHEQSRIDRDNYIYINWRNINPRMKYNFEKYKPGDATTYGEPYDYNSVMHYDQYAFSSNGQRTITARSDPNIKLGQRDGLSDIDVKQLMKHYNCKATTKSTSENKKVKKKKPRVWCGDQYDNCAKYKSNCKTLKVVKKWCRKTCNLCGKSSKKKVSSNKGKVRRKKVPSTVRKVRRKKAPSTVRKVRRRKVPSTVRRVRRKTVPSTVRRVRKVTSSRCADTSLYCDSRSCSNTYTRNKCKRTCGRCRTSSRFSDEPEDELMDVSKNEQENELEDELEEKLEEEILDEDLFE